MPNDLIADPRTTALVAIDLQKSVVARQVAPYSAADVIARTRQIADALRRRGGLIVFVNVDVRNVPLLPTDKSMRDPSAPPPPPNASELVAEIGITDADVLVTKRQWGAFYGTDLDQQLRRHSIRTIIMSGIATNIGVESTARAAHDRGYHLVFAEDAMTSRSAEMHQFAITQIFPFMGRVRPTDELIQALQ